MDKQIKVKNIPTEVKIQKPENASLDDRFNPRNRIYVRAVSVIKTIMTFISFMKLTILI